jgi:hypothetical protein
MNNLITITEVGSQWIVFVQKHKKIDKTDFVNDLYFRYVKNDNKVIIGFINIYSSKGEAEGIKGYIINQVFPIT